MELFSLLKIEAVCLVETSYKIRPHKLGEFMPRLPLLLLTAPLIAYVSTVSAEDKTYQINLPEQSLNSAIDSLAQQTGIKPFYADALVAGKKSPSVTGQYSAQQALDKLLAGSGLSYKFNDKQAVAITKQNKVSSATTLPAV